MAEKAYEKYAWVLLFVLGVLALAMGVVSLLGVPLDPQGTENLTGMTPEEIRATYPGIADELVHAQRGAGLFLLWVAVLVMAVAAFPYRKGERWAWYIFWIIPIGEAGFMPIDLIDGRSLWPIAVVVIVIGLAGLLLPYRKFFPKT